MNIDDFLVTEQQFLEYYNDLFDDHCIHFVLEEVTGNVVDSCSYSTGYMFNVLCDDQMSIDVIAMAKQGLQN